MSSDDQSTGYAQADLARYLSDLGFDAMVLPGGMPKTDSDRTVSSKPSTRASQRSESRGPQRPAPPRQDGGAPRVHASEPPQRTPAARFEIDSDMSIESRADKLEEVRTSALSCTACVLCEKRNEVVFGSGNANADLMIIGEGPGAQEDKQGLPFVGPAGELLTKMLKAIEFDRSDVFIANVVKCRPPGNRDPRPDEVDACSGYLEAQVKLVQPKVILALGRVAAQALLRTDTALGRMRNQWHRYQDVPVWVTYHPAALLRNASYKRPAWEDLQHVRDHLAKPSE